MCTAAAALHVGQSCRIDVLEQPWHLLACLQVPPLSPANVAVPTGMRGSWNLLPSAKMGLPACGYERVRAHVYVFEWGCTCA